MSSAFFRSSEAIPGSGVGLFCCWSSVHALNLLLEWFLPIAFVWRVLQSNFKEICPSSLWANGWCLRCHLWLNWVSQKWERLGMGLVFLSVLMKIFRNWCCRWVQNSMNILKSIDVFVLKKWMQYIAMKAVLRWMYNWVNAYFKIEENS